MNSAFHGSQTPKKKQCVKSEMKLLNRLNTTDTKGTPKIRNVTAQVEQKNLVVSLPAGTVRISWDRVVNVAFESAAIFRSKPNN